MQTEAGLYGSFMRGMGLFEGARSAFCAALFALGPVLLPAVLTYPAVQPGAISSFLLAATVFGLSFFLMQMSRAMACRREEILRRTWGGRPAVRMLRHSDGVVDGLTKRRWHESFAAGLKLPFPARSQERFDPALADDTYACAVFWAERQTRDRLTFRSLWDRREQYSFLLHFHAVRVVGIVAAVGALLWASVSDGTVSVAPQSGWGMAISLSVRQSSVGVFVLSSLLLFAWCFFFTEARVKAAAWSYDRQLLEEASYREA